MKKHRYIGLDVHKESISMAVAEAGRNETKLSHGSGRRKCQEVSTL